MPAAHPALSDEEYARLKHLRDRGGRGSGWRVLAGDLNRMRTANVYSPEVVRAKSVTHEWLRRAYAVAALKRQDQGTVKTHTLLSLAAQASSVKTDACHTVPRVSNEPSRNDAPLMNGPLTPDKPAFAVEVNNERMEATR